MHKTHRRLCLRRDPLANATKVEHASYNGFTISVADDGVNKKLVFNRRPPEVLLKVIEIWRANQSSIPLQEFINLSLDSVDPDDI